MTAAPDLDPDHRDDCPGAVLGTFIGRRGDTLTRCISCGRIKVHPDPERDHAPEDEPHEPPAPLARLVCREHHGEPVNARGKGCRPCANDHAQRVAARKRRKGKPETTE